MKYLSTTKSECFTIIKMQALCDSNDYHTACQSQTDDSWLNLPLQRYKDPRNQELYTSHFWAYLNELRGTD